jgi:hypothetical protein
VCVAGGHRELDLTVGNRQSGRQHRLAREQRQSQRERTLRGGEPLDGGRHRPIEPEIELAGNAHEGRKFLAPARPGIGSGGGRRARRPDQAQRIGEQPSFVDCRPPAIPARSPGFARAVRGTRAARHPSRQRAAERHFMHAFGQREQERTACVAG